MFEDIDNDPRVELALRIYNDAEGLAGSEVAEGMQRALQATDQETIDNLVTEYFGVDDEDGDEATPLAA